jgi:hypothetical protein
MKELDRIVIDCHARIRLYDLTMEATMSGVITGEVDTRIQWGEIIDRHHFKIISATLVKGAKNAAPDATVTV